MKWLEIAWTQQGISETAGAGATPEIVAYFREAGHPEVASDEVAWCAAFVGACLERAGIASTKSLRARSYEKHGTAIPLDTPRVGAIAVFKRTADPALGHVGFVTGWTATTIALLGGNQGNAVSVKHYPRADLVALRWPAPAKSPGEIAELGSRTMAAVTQQIRDVGKGALLLGSAGAAAVVETPAETATKVIGHAPTAMSAIETAEKFAMFAAAKWPWIAGAGALWLLARTALAAKAVAEARAEDHNTGANVARSSTDAAAG